MPLASPIGSGQGMVGWAGIQRIVERISVPVVVDAGIGVPSDATTAMELGADAVLVNTAIARAGDPARMAEAMKLGTRAGRLAYLAGRMPVSLAARPSDPRHPDDERLLKVLAYHTTRHRTNVAPTPGYAPHAVLSPFRLLKLSGAAHA